MKVSRRHIIMQDMGLHKPSLRVTDLGQGSGKGLSIGLRKPSMHVTGLDQGNSNRLLTDLWAAETVGMHWPRSRKQQWTFDRYVGCGNRRYALA